ncbi:MAG: acetyl-CoA carboxylase carboxyltransferase subunit alpha [Opitutales bacterium]
MASQDRSTFLLDFEKPIQQLEDHLSHLRASSEANSVDMSAEIRAIETKIEATKRDIHARLTPWQRIQLARHPRRPYSLDYLARLTKDFQNLQGDRVFREDAAIVGGPAWFRGRAVMVVGQQKGRSTKENLKRNFGCPNPEGYRKALRLMKLAEQYRLPVIALVDTPGAYPGIGSEERHVAEAIAVNLREMAAMTVPIVAAVIGEGGSGGALGIAVANRVLILRNAYYSVISPEGCAAILWKDRAQAPRAAEALQITSDRLYELGIVDEIVEEPIAGAHADLDAAATLLGDALERHLGELDTLSGEALRQDRYAKFRQMGVFEAQSAESGRLAGS